MDWSPSTAGPAVTLLVLLLGAACGSSSPGRSTDAATDAPAWAPDAAGDLDGGADADAAADEGDDLASDRADPPDAAVDSAPDSEPGAEATGGSDGPEEAEISPPESAPPGVPLPSTGPQPVRFLDSSVLLAAFEDQACTNQDDATGDRWCAFVKLAPAGIADLWVINVSVAATGQVPPCDGSSPHCLNLSHTLAAGAYFDGDTLLYYADRLPGTAGEFMGVVHAWRPGWPRGRALTGPRGVMCFGHARAAVAGCLEAADPERADAAILRVGPLAGPDDGLLPALGGTWSLLDLTVSLWQAGFSPDGETLVFSYFDAAAGLSTLRSVATRQAAGAVPTPALTDLGRWSITNDGAAIYFERGTRGNTTLYVADFPGGANVVAVSDSVRDFALLGDQPGQQGLGLLQRQANNVTAFNLYRDRTVTTPTTLFTFQGVLEALSVSGDLALTAWVDGDFRGRLLRNDDLSVCALNLPGEPAVSNLNILAHGGLAFFTQSAPENPSRPAGYLVVPGACREKQRFATRLTFHTPVGDRGLLFGDEEDPFTGAVTLKYAAIAADGHSFAEPGIVRVAQSVQPPILRAGNRPMLLVYRTVDGSGTVTGVWVFGPVPF